MDHNSLDYKILEVQGELRLLGVALHLLGVDHNQEVVDGVATPFFEVAGMTMMGVGMLLVDSLRVDYAEEEDNLLDNLNLADNPVVRLLEACLEKNRFSFVNFWISWLTISHPRD